MYKNIFIFATCFLGYVTHSYGQCADPTNISLLKDSSNYVTITWSGPLDSFKVEFGPQGFTQGTGSIHKIYDTTFTFQHIIGCFSTEDVYITRFCNSGVSNTVGPTPFSKDNSNLIYPNGIFWTHSRICGDSLNPVLAGFRFHIFWQQPPNDLPASFKTFGGTGWPNLYADGDLDTVMSYYTAFIDTAGSNDAVFFGYSNNVTNVNDNVTLNIHLNDGDTTISNVYTYSGNDENWKKHYIDLKPYKPFLKNKFRLVFEVDQKTAQNPKWNDFVIVGLFVGDTSTCGIQKPIELTRPSPTSLRIKRLLW